MKRQRLVVVSDPLARLEEPSIVEAFGSVEAWNEWMAQSQGTEATVDATDAGVIIDPIPDARSLKMLMVLMERPFFALNRRKMPISYQSNDGSIAVDVQPGPGGMATIQDADILMFLIDQMATMPEGAGGTVMMKAGDYFRAIGSKLGGDQYRLLREAIERLATTRVTTNAQPDGKPGPVVTFPWIESAEQEGKSWKLTVPAWLAEGARSSAVLDISQPYFALRGMSRGLYLIARKHLGRQDIVFSIRTSKLWAKLGSADTLAHFRHAIRKVVADDLLPDFRLQWEDGPDGLLKMSHRSSYSSFPK